MDKSTAKPKKCESCALQCHHNERDGVSNHRRINYLLNDLQRSKKTSKLRITSLCEGNPPVIGGFPSQRASNTKKFQLMTSSSHQVFVTIKTLYWITPYGTIDITDGFPDLSIHLYDINDLSLFISRIRNRLIWQHWIRTTTGTIVVNIPILNSFWKSHFINTTYVMSLLSIENVFCKMHPWHTYSWNCRCTPSHLLWKWAIVHPHDI